MITSLETIYADLINNNCDNLTILENYVKAHKYFGMFNKILVSLSGGSDSDIVLDICHNLDPDNEKCTYIWFDTGIEYDATKRHLDYLEERYNIKIQREKAIKSIPYCCKTYGQPFISKMVSQHISDLQRINFEWDETKDYMALIHKYCERVKRDETGKIIGTGKYIDINGELYRGGVGAILWWCDFIGTTEWGTHRSYRVAISQNMWLREFMMQNPPKFKISSACCDYAKKTVAKHIYNKNDFDLSITGVRQAEGGIRSIVYKGCFSEEKLGKHSYRPVWWYKDVDKLDYENCFNIVHSDCYTKYGMVRTGCAGCPYSLWLESDLLTLEQYEPQLFKGVSNIFKDSYEYTKAFKDFRKEQKRLKKESKNGKRKLF